MRRSCKVLFYELINARAKSDLYNKPKTIVLLYLSFVNVTLLYISNLNHDDNHNNHKIGLCLLVPSYCLS